MEKKMIVYSKKMGYIGTIVEYDGETVKLYDEHDGSYEKVTLKQIDKMGCSIVIE